jgi:hypothetical protein
VRNTNTIIPHDARCIKIHPHFIGGHLNFAFRRFNSSLLSLQYFGYYFLLFNQERPHNPEIKENMLETPI